MKIRVDPRLMYIDCAVTLSAIRQSSMGSSPRVPLRSTLGCAYLCAHTGRHYLLLTPWVADCFYVLGWETSLYNEAWIIC